MFDRLEIMRMAQAYATHASTRQQAIAQNVANADTPAYRSREVIPFTDFWAAFGDGSLPDRDTIIEEARPATVSPNGNSVSVETEMMRAVEARQQHEAALGIYSTVRDMLRASLGR